MTDGIRELADRYWALVLETNPTAATLLGIHDHDDRLADLSRETEVRTSERYRELLNETTALTGLGTDDEVTRSLLVHQISVGLDQTELRLMEMASDQMLGPHVELLMEAPQFTYPEPRHAEAALVRYQQVPRFLDQALDRFREGLAAGRTPAKAVLDRSLNSLDGYLATDVADDPFPAATLPDGWEGADEWRERVGELVTTTIRPAFQRFRDALSAVLGPHARPDDRAGWCHLPDGDALYGALIRMHTTITPSPQEIHDLGRLHCEQVLPLEYAEVGARAFGISDVPAIFDRLRTDPSLKHASGEEILETAKQSVAAATAVMADWFGRLPAAPCQVMPVPDFLAADAPYAYYFPPAIDGSRPGTYFINTSDPDHASRTEAESIAYHEAIPGHHLQISISQELDSLPDFQKHDGATSYIEGWGLYAERLAVEMGLYTDDLALLGMLAADSWRSARLVVDTGLHALGWSRDQALAYFEEYTPVPMDQVLPEVDRYIAMPGQALSYKIGQLEIQRLRAKAEAELGDEFDIRRFHDTVLGSGAVTLPVLAELVEDWLVATKS